MFILNRIGSDQIEFGDILQNAQCYLTKLLDDFNEFSERQQKIFLSNTIVIKLQKCKTKVP